MNQSGESEIWGNESLHNLGNRSEKLGLDYDEEDYIFDSQYVRLGFFSLYTIVFCVCFFGNLAVVLVVTLHWKMRGVTKFCLGNLAFANLCVGIFCVYQNLTTFLIDRWVFGHFMCKMYHFINSLSHTASILILVVICVERYLAILHPFKSRQWITRRRLRAVIAAVWILSAVLCSPRLYYINTYYIRVAGQGDGEVRFDMICAPQQTLYDAHIVDTVYFILLFLLPLLVITILYSCIGIHLWRDNDLISTKLPSQFTLHSFHRNVNSEAITLSSDSTSTSNGSRQSTCRTTRISSQLSPRRGRSPRPSDLNNSIQSLPCSHELVEELNRMHSQMPKRDSKEDSVSQISFSNSMERRGKKVTVRFHICHKGSKHGRERRGNHEGKYYFKTQFRCTNEIDGRNSVEKEKHLLFLQGQSVPSNLTRPENSIKDGSHETIMMRSDSLNKRSKTVLPKKASHSKVLKCGNEKKASESKRRKPRQAVLRMLIVIVVTFAVCNLPFHLRKLCVNFLQSYDLGSNLSNLFTPLTFLFMYTNCAINPIIYAFMSKDFRSSLQDLLRGRLKRKLLKRKRAIPV